MAIYPTAFIKMLRKQMYRFLECPTDGYNGNRLMMGYGFFGDAFTPKQYAIREIPLQRIDQQFKNLMVQ